MDIKSIIELIDDFLSFPHKSMSKAGLIEVAIDKAFPDDEYMQGIVQILSLYSPAGGEYYYSEDEIIQTLLQVRKKLEEEYLQ